MCMAGTVARPTIECDREKTEPTLHAKDLIHHSILRDSPANEGKVSKSGEDEVGKPIPAKRDRESYEEGVS